MSNKTTKTDKGNPEDVERREAGTVSAAPETETDYEEVEAEEAEAEDVVEVEAEGDFEAEADDGFAEPGLEDEQETEAEETDEQAMKLIDVPDYRANVQKIEQLKNKDTLSKREQRKLAELEYENETMDQLMEEIDVDDTNTIIRFGSEAHEELQDVSERIMDMATNDGTFNTTISGVKEAATELDYDAFADRAKSYLKAAAKKHGAAAGAAGAAAAVSGPLALITAPAAWFGAKGAQKKLKQRREAKNAAKEFDATAEEAREDLKNMKVKLDTLRLALETARDVIPQQLEEIDKLGRARAEAYKNMSLYIGAADEKRIRVAEEELTEAREEFEENPESFAAREDLEEMQRVYDRLQTRVRNMYTSRYAFHDSTTKLKFLRGRYDDALDKVNDHLTQSYPQWCSEGAQVALALRLHDIADALGVADDFADSMLDQSATLQEETRKQLEHSSRRGTYDPQKVAKALERSTANYKALTDMTQRSNESYDEEFATMQKAYEENLGAANELTHAKANRAQRQLESAHSRHAALEDKSGADKKPKSPFNKEAKGTSRASKSEPGAQKTTRQRRSGGPGAKNS